MLIGAAAGALGSIAVTSEKGKEVREDLLEKAKNASRKLRKEANVKIDDARDDIADLIDELRERLETLEENIRVNREAE